MTGDKSVKNHSKKAMILAQKFGWSVDIKYYLDSLEYSKLLHPNSDMIPTKRSEIALNASHVATAYYLLGDLKSSARFARDMISATLELYFGNWTREVVTDLGTRDQHWWRLHWTWMHPFSQGLCWASALGAWSSVKKFAAHPLNECDVDPSFTKEDKAAYLALSCFLRKERPQHYAGHFEEIAKRKKEKPKLLAEVIRALQSKRSAAYQTSLEHYLHYFKKREFKRNALDKLLSFDGTTLINIGAHRGLNFKCPPEFEDHIIRLK